MVVETEFTVPLLLRAVVSPPAQHQHLPLGAAGSCLKGGTLVRLFTGTSTFSSSCWPSDCPRCAQSFWLPSWDARLHLCVQYEPVAQAPGLGFRDQASSTKPRSAWFWAQGINHRHQTCCFLFFFIWLNSLCFLGLFDYRSGAAILLFRCPGMEGTVRWSRQVCMQ